MSRLGLMDRVKSWFGGPKYRRQAAARQTAGRLLLAAAGASAASSQTDCAFDGSAAPSAVRDDAHEAPAVAAAPPPRTVDAEREARQAEWVRLLDSLPERIAESLAASAAGARALEHIGRELEGHRDATRTLAQSVARLPSLATDQAALTKRTHELLARQAHLAEAAVDGLAAMRAALGSVEESAQRHLLAIGELEHSHREVLETYQRLVLATHRRLGRLAALAVLTASAALGAVAYVLWLVLAAS